MNTLDKTFLEKIDEISHDNIKVSYDDKLLLYGLYQQATIGNINIPKPCFIRHYKQLEWYAWNKNRNMTQHDAKNRYILEVEDIIKYQESQKLWSEMRDIFKIRSY